MDSYYSVENTRLEIEKDLADLKSSDPDVVENRCSSLAELISRFVMDFGPAHQWAPAILDAVRTGPALGRKSAMRLIAALAALKSRKELRGLTGDEAWISPEGKLLLEEQHDRVRSLRDCLKGRWAVIAAAVFDDEASMRFEAALLLAQIEAPRAEVLPALISQLMLEGDGAAREGLTTAIGFLGGPTQASLLQSLVEREERAAECGITASALLCLAPNLATARLLGLSVADARSRWTTAVLNNDSFSSIELGGTPYLRLPLRLSARAMGCMLAGVFEDRLGSTVKEAELVCNFLLARGKKGGLPKDCVRIFLNLVDDQVRALALIGMVRHGYRDHGKGRPSFQATSSLLRCVKTELAARDCPDLRAALAAAGLPTTPDSLEDWISPQQDPLERDPRFRRAFEEAEALAEAELANEPHGYGSCHTLWEVQARILAERGGIRWWTPPEIHPNTLFD